MVSCWHKDKQNKVVHKEKDPLIYEQLTLDKGAKAFHWRESLIFSKNGTRTIKTKI